MKRKASISSVALMLLLSGAAAQSHADKVRHSSNRRCEDASLLLSAIGAHLYEQGFENFLVNAPPEPGPYRGGLPMGAALDPDLRNRWSAQPPQSIFACIEGSSFAGLPIISSAEEHRLRSTAAPNSPLLFIRVGAPVFDSSRKHALLLYSSIAGASLGGHTELYYLQRTGTPGES